MEFRRDVQAESPGYTGRGESLAFRMAPLGPAPQRVIAPGETVTSPEMHLGLVHRGADELTRVWHQHLRASVIPPRPVGKAHYVTGGRVVEQPGEWILREIDLAADLGVEAFMVDAGWYGEAFGGWWDRRGDWDQVGDWIPGGLTACRERAHARGLLFGLWLEPEGVGPQSRLLREHPEWLLRTDGEAVINAPHAPALDLSHPEAARFLTDSILRVIREHQLDFFKIDYNFRVHEGGQHEREGFVESELWRHYETLYAAFDQVRRELPEVALECCASGGGRNDLGMLSRLHYACESDFSEFPRAIRALNGLTRFLPPEALCYYHNHLPTAHQRTDLETHLRVTLFAQTIFVGFGNQDADLRTEYFETTRRYLRLAREFTGPILGGHPQVFHHTPDVGVLGPADWVVLEYAARDRSAGYVGVFRLNGAAPETWLLQPRGLDPARRYAVTLDNLGQTLEMDGAELRLRGLPLRLDAAYTSELVLYRALE
jgi:alpha-galactosidase